MNKYPGKPILSDLRHLFRTDLQKNLARLSKNFTKELYMGDFVREAVIYSCDMCVELREKTGPVPDDFLVDTEEEIVNQVCDVMFELNPKFSEEYRKLTHSKVKENMCRPDIKDFIQNYQITNYR